MNKVNIAALAGVEFWSTSGVRASVRHVDDLITFSIDFLLNRTNVYGFYKLRPNVACWLIHNGANIRRSFYGFNPQCSANVSKVQLTPIHNEGASLQQNQRPKQDHCDDPLNHILYFHTRCELSSGYSADSPDINAGLHEALEFTGDNGNQVPTPFKSVTTDPLRAFNYALRLQDEEKDGIEIVIIDAWFLSPYNVIPCNTLRRLVGEEENNLFNTELLVYRSIPGDTIIARIQWPTICNSLGKILPPISDSSRLQNGMHSLGDLRLSLQGLELEISNLIKILLDDFHLFQSSLVTKQIAMMILGWTQGYSRVDDYPRLQALLKLGARKDAIHEIDYRLYIRSLRERQRFYLHLMPDGTESLDVMERKITIYTKVSALAYEDWLVERLNLEKFSFQQASEPGPKAGDLIPSLRSIGINAKSTRIQ
ncbi:hypothetical protein FQN55_009178 [Onygenales sp. PD_40]|nr:hypothetical protein FQN55_009178 [Onygenales sp. PD_40]